MSAYPVVNYTSEHTTSNKRLQQAQILEMRSAGLSFEHIGREIGTTKGYAYKLYVDALNAIITPGVEHLRKQEGERLDMMLVPVMSKIMDARNAAIMGQPFEAPLDEIDAALKISARRSLIFGLNAPTKLIGNVNIPNPGDIMNSMNLAAMDTAELLKFRELLAKATDQVEPQEADQDADGPGS